MNTAEKLKLYKSVLARDPRFDGRFFIGVKTTGIYCRPICPAKPKFENVEFYRSKAEAEHAGFRPCLRCKPDLSPLSPQWRGTAAVMGRALSLIESGEEHIADKLGMSDRHLRRLFHEHIGASPVEVAISRRLHLARQLLSQTKLGIGEIAYASGFNSLRRFNDAFLKTYKMPPGSFRKEEASSSANDTNFITIKLPYSPPYDWEWLMNFFSRHLTIGVEWVENNQYFRHLKTSKGINFYKLSHLPKEQVVQAEIIIKDVSDLRFIIEQIKSQMDLTHNPFHIDSPKFKKELKSVRIPGGFDPFETAISIVLGHVVSTEQGKRNIQKLVLKYGEESKESQHPQLTHFFPTAKVLSSADLSTLGFTNGRCEAIRELARKISNNEIQLSKNCDLTETRAQLMSIKGIGAWTTELILMRCASDTDAFPANDLILKRALESEHIDLDAISPWRSYLALAIWKNKAHLLSKKKRKV